MKKQILILVIGGFFTQVQAQKLMEKQVPMAVTSAFKKAYPDVKDIDWSKDGKNYEAQYDNGKMDNSVTYDVNGMFIENEMQIMVSELPLAVVEYVKKNHAGYKIKEAAKIMDVNNITTYEAEVNGKDLIFDANGMFIKAIKN